MKNRKELIAYRTPNTKRFLKKDGTIDVEIYDENIHYLKNGKYEEIDNTLIETTSCFTNNQNDFKVEFKKNSKDMINISQNNNTLTMSLKNIEYISANKKVSRARSIRDDISYNNIYKNISLNYEIRSNKLKESIILSKLPEQDEIIFTIKTNLSLILNRDNTISIKSKRKERFKIEKPYMVDSDNIISQDVNYNLEKTEEGYEIKIIPDKEWLRDPKRVYPVVIDPTITGVKENKKVIDTYIYEGDNQDTTYNTDILKIGKEIINNKEVECTSLIKFELPKIPTSHSVIDAKLFLVGYPSDNYTSESTNNPMVSVHQITQDWKEETAKWQTMNNKFNKTIENYFYSTLSPAVDSYGKIDVKTSIVNITNLVQKWYSNEPNYGLMLRKLEVEGTEIIDKCSKYFSNDNKVTGDNPKPRLIITYRDFNGLEGYLSYTSQSHELGSSHINNYNGNLTSTFNVANTIDGPLPVSLSLIYNTADVISDEKIDYGYGLGIKPNMIQTIQKETIEEKEILRYLDEDGTNHYFYKKVIDATTKPVQYSNEYYDEDGLGLKIEVINNNYIMTDKDSNISKFVKRSLNNKETFFLEEVKDTNNKSIKIIYDSNNRIAKIIDASNNEINVNYETNKIIFISPHKTVIVNYEDNKLISIENLGNVETILYNSNNLIEKIKNSNGTYIKYKYINNLIFKVSKVTEYSSLEEEGNYLEFTYNFKTTKIKDRKGHTKTYTFGEYGNVETILTYDSEEDVGNAFAKTIEYGELGKNTSNKIVLDTNYTKYVDNSIRNSSFEHGIDYLDYIVSSSNISFDESNDAHYGTKALKVTSTKDNEYFIRNCEVKKGFDYTFSAYIKNNVPTKISLIYDNTEEEFIINKTSEEYNRYDVTINYPESATDDLQVKFTLLEKGEILIDDLQLEEGLVANQYNFIFDGSYKISGLGSITGLLVLPNGTMSINTVKTDIVKVGKNSNAFKIPNIPYVIAGVEEFLTISGKKDDIFQYSFWYKNEGVKIDEEAKDWFKSNIKVKFTFLKGDNIVGETLEDDLTYWNTEWHYFSKKYIAPADFDKIKLEIPAGSNVNDIYLTNLMLFKDLEDYSYTYDDNGNLVSSVDLSKETSKFAYNSNNQLIQVTTPKGANYKFEYDDNITDRLIRAISPTSITNAIDYDENNNPIKTTINNSQAFEEIIDATYYIRARGTDAYIYVNPNKTLKIKECECSHDKFRISLQPNGRLKISSAIMPNYFLKNNNGALKLEYGDNNNLFELIKHANKSYSIKSASNNTAITVDNNKTLLLSTYDENNANQQFLFERMESKLFIENSAKYTEDGRFIKSVKDAIGNEMTYDINQTNGLTNNIVSPNGIMTNYAYDDKLRIKKITSDDYKVEYEYDTANNLSNIKHGTKNYQFKYDNFGNTSEIRINEKVLVNNYIEENNGNLTKVKYGNGQEINYYYDEFDRIKTMKKSNDNYTKYYDNFGRITRIRSNESIYNYNYDFAGRLSTFKYNNYKSSFDYGKENTISKKIEELGFKKYTYNYIYNSESALTSMNILGNTFNYIYDNLGRIKESNINNIYKTTYNYITRGNKTTTTIDKVNDNGTEYFYTYDSQGNIVEIKKNNILLNKYKYDTQNQLIQDENLVDNKTTKYLYDLYGNILSRKEYKYNSDTLLKEDKYEYKDNNWQDLLTKFNNQEITYDAIGNPLKIGSKNLTWQNGRELSSYKDESNEITFKYGANGVRTSKIVNGIKTNYILEDSTIVFEEKEGDVIYYIYGGNGIEGLEYKNKLYYYHKNILGDIIGILDSDYNEVVSYSYDSWGKVTNIIDHSNIDLGRINPFRYRSYYYDEETQLYYLNTRYYNPEWKRFINADSLITGQGFNGNNLFSYCNNSPIIYKDINGNFVFTAGLAASILIGSIVGGAVGAGLGQITANILNGDSITNDLGYAIGVGATAGLVGGTLTCMFSYGLMVAPALLPYGASLMSTLGSSATSVSLGVLSGKIDAQQVLPNFIIESSFGNLSDGTTTSDILMNYAASGLEFEYSMFKKNPTIQNNNKQIINLNTFFPKKCPVPQNSKNTKVSVTVSKENMSPTTYKGGYTSPAKYKGYTSPATCPVDNFNKLISSSRYNPF